MSTEVNYRAAHESTNLPLMQARDLLYALYDLATDHPVLNTPEPAASAIISMISCAEEKVTAAIEAHDAEWDAAKRIPEQIERNTHMTMQANIDPTLKWSRFSGQLSG